ncbi:PREDICTED: UPF0481 protein At3g47200-like [Ipomoea nil]|uniref:UPF0481 protein At3g47200-like n=1 Tax=Ipomoea nil TaxID=35883 RepID=UPI0009019A0E|nr:PREDICTED: UPF0481 protein At3g47200-like [Ipomoea nil]XP_019164577.1 PREDICTED: UPF0481 protein At3g47200-like [Ipomoea nil]
MKPNLQFTLNNLLLLIISSFDLHTHHIHSLYSTKLKMQGSASTSSSATIDHVTVEIIPEETLNLLSSINSKMESLSISNCICRLPQHVSKGNEHNYFPKRVSIGPFHRGNAALRAMEVQKWRYLNALLSRGGQDTESALDACIERLRRLESRARKCYGGGGEGRMIGLGRDEFVEMMLLDGCFIIELLLRFAFRGIRRKDDPCFSSREAFSGVRSDLILAENQIPFFVVEHLYKVVPLPKDCSSFSLAHLFLLFVRKLIDRPPEGSLPATQDQKFGPFVYHLLDLVRHCYLPATPPLQSTATGEQKNLYSATQLQAAGIKFRKKALSSTDQSILDITYDDRGVLAIPPIKVENHTETLFRNIIALEEYTPHQTTNHYVASYVYLMKCLIRCKEDVSFLRRKGILIVSGTMGNDEEIVGVFDSLHVKINGEDEEFYYRGLCEKVNRFSNVGMEKKEKKKKKKEVLWQKMGDVYHRTPWGAAVFVVAILALVSSLSAALFFAITFLFHHA